MKRCWTDDELLQHFTLRLDELALISSSTTDHNRLGFAVLLKYFEYSGRFPENRSLIPSNVIRYLANQLDIPPETFNQYNWQGRSIRQHRAHVRQWFNFRPYAESKLLSIAFCRQSFNLKNSNKSICHLTCLHQFLPRLSFVFDNGLPSKFQASYVDIPPQFATHCWLPFVCVVLLRLPMTWLNV